MSIVYLFEDKETDKLSSFYRLGFQKSISDNFRYSNGNANLYKEAVKILKEPDTDLVTIFMDLVPNNEVTAEIFNQLCLLAMEQLHKVFIVPTLGSEYYFIKSLLNRGIENNTEILQTYCNVNYYIDVCKPFFDSTGMKERRYSTFEQLGKRIIEHNFPDCISHPKEGLRNYYTQGCRCYSPKPYNCSHTELSVEDKVKSMLIEYKIIPYGSIFGQNNKVTIDLRYAFKVVSEYLIWVRDRARDEFKITDESIEMYNQTIDNLEELRCLWYA